MRLVRGTRRAFSRHGRATACAIARTATAVEISQRGVGAVLGAAEAALYNLLAEQLEAAPQTTIDQRIPNTGNRATKNRWVHPLLQEDALAGDLPQIVGDVRAQLLV